VAAQTKIGSHYLEAMEENQFDRLPGGLFTRSFLRQYTHTLGLDENEVLAPFLQQVEAAPVPPRERRRGFSLPPYLPHLRIFVWLAITMAGCSVIYQLWENRPKGLDETAAVQPHAEPNGDASLNAKASHRNEALPKISASDVREDHAVVPAVASESTSRPAVAALRVVLAASEPVWISVKTDGVATYNGTLEGQQSREFDASAKMTVLVGNAGGLAISANGTQVALRGTHGEVRLVELTPNGAHVIPRMPPPAPTLEDHSAAPTESERHP
jgi:cytoskeletal protein RodZ